MVDHAETSRRWDQWTAAEKEAQFAEVLDCDLETDRERLIERKCGLLKISKRAFKLDIKAFGGGPGGADRKASGGAAKVAPMPLCDPEPEPWDEPVDGQALFEGLRRELARYLVLEPQALTVLSAWALFSHVSGEFVVLPYLHVTSPTPGSGKSTVGDLLAQLVRVPARAEYMTPAFIYRLIEAEKPTLILDEVDTQIRGNHRLRGILNSGFRRDGRVGLVQGDQVIGLSTATVSRLIRAGELERVKVGRAAFVPLDSVLKFVARRKAHAAAAGRGG